MLHSNMRNIVHDSLLTLAIAVKEHRWVIAAVLLVTTNLLYCELIYKSISVLTIGLLFSLSVIGIYLLFSYLKQRSCTDIGLFTALLSLLGILYIVIFPPFLVPDSVYHFESAYQYSNCFLLLFPIEGESLFMRAGDMEFIQNRTHLLSNDFYHSLFQQSSLFLDNSDIIWADISGASGNAIPTIFNNPPQLRIASAIGITIARLLNLSSLATFYFGEIFNLAVFVALLYAAVKITPIGKRIFMTAALLPMTLHIACSYSYDSPIIGMAFLMTAILLRFVFSHDHISKKELVLSLVLMALLAPCKVVYVLIGLLACAIPSKTFPNKRISIIYKTSLLGIGLLSIVAFNSPALISTLFEPEHMTSLDTRGTETGEFYSLSYLIGNPIESAAIFLNTLGDRGDFYINTLIGGSLGWFDQNIAAPWFLIIAFVLIILISMIPKSSDIPFPYKTKVIMGSIGVACSLLIMLSMFIGWTFTTENVIQGVQGRYFLPILPLILLAISPNQIVAKRDYTMPLLVTTSLLNTCYLTYIFAKAMAV